MTPTYFTASLTLRPCTLILSSFAVQIIFFILALNLEIFDQYPPGIDDFINEESEASLNARAEQSSQWFFNFKSDEKTNIWKEIPL